jgi:cyclopropane-fatty-acyl-phospholipid synthase
MCICSDIFLHRDKSLMPRNPIAWSAWNILETSNNNVCVTYWINILQEVKKVKFKQYLKLFLFHMKLILS